MSKRAKYLLGSDAPLAAWGGNFVAKGSTNRVDPRGNRVQGRAGRLRRGVRRKGVLEGGAALPASPEDLPSSTLLSRNNIILNFRAEDQGKRCGYAAYWQTRRGLMGPWTGSISVLAPWEFGALRA